MTQPMQDYGSLFSAVQDVNAEAAEAIAAEVERGNAAFAARFALAAILPVAEHVNAAQAVAVTRYALGPKGSEPVTVHASSEGLRVYRDSRGIGGSPWLHPDGALTQVPPGG